MLLVIVRVIIRVRFAKSERKHCVRVLVIEAVCCLIEKYQNVKELSFVSLTKIDSFRSTTKQLTP